MQHIASYSLSKQISQVTAACKLSSGHPWRPVGTWNSIIRTPRGTRCVDLLYLGGKRSFVCFVVPDCHLGNICIYQSTGVCADSPVVKCNCIFNKHTLPMETALTLTYVLVPIVLYQKIYF